MLSECHGPRGQREPDRREDPQRDDGRDLPGLLAGAVSLAGDLEAGRNRGKIVLLP
jgi:hypothetical protein